ncbi:MAG: 2Fe-2S iron-sulfur cluster-binding protein [Planctomycetota bacterium]|jgi:NADH dehydrogenase/NADH:ubiquinone oxidoreductase subunit G
MINFTLNNKQLQVEEGRTVLEVAREQDIKIPTLCYHKELTAYGACRLCLVEIVAGGRCELEAACVYKVTDGLEVKTDTDRVKRARKIVFELLMARCPDAEKIKELAKEYGVTGTRIKLEKKENCILCGLCVRVCAEISQRHAQSFSGRGVKRKVQTPFNKLSEECIGCGACVYLCPVESLKIEEAD